MNLLVSDDWGDEFDDFYGEGQYYDSYQYFTDDLFTPVRNTRKIVELVDTGCDARSSTLGEKTSKFAKNSARASNYRGSRTEKSAVSEATAARRSAGDTPATRIPVLPTDDAADSPEMKSLDKRVVSSITFHVADRQTDGRDEDEDFEDFENFDEIENRELQTRKRLTDRAVDSDCLSVFSRPSIGNIECASSTTVNLRRKNVKIKTHEINPSKDAGTKKLTKSNESVEDKLPSRENRRAKSSRSSRTGGPSSAVRNSRDRENLRSRINLEQSDRKLESTSRTIIKDKKVKTGTGRSEIPRPIMREGDFTMKRDSARFAKRTSVEGSRLPVWQGRRRKSKVPSNFDDSRGKISEDESEVAGILKSKGRVEVNYSEEELRKNEKNEKFIGEEDSDVNEKVSGVTFEEDEIRGQSEFKDTDGVEYRGREETKGTVRAQSSVESKEIAGNKVASENKVEDQSKSDLWNKNYEEAFAKGRAVGLRVFRMAEAAREERKREFRKYGFEDYKRRPREQPQEIVDIGVTLLEKALDNGKENYYKRN